ncbi:alpha-hydroxy-acid oxidizing protein [Streptomyces sp. NPDC004752]
MRASRIVNAADYKRVARRRLPRMAFDFLEGAVLDELTNERNIRDVRGVEFKQRAFPSVSALQTDVSMLGQRCEVPFFIAPMGMLGLMHPDADVDVARAAHRAGAVFIHSAWSGVSLPEVAAAAPGHVWSQVNFWKERAHTERHLAQARDLGIDVLVLPGDCVLGDKREHDLHHGLNRLPPALSLPDLLSCAVRPRWVSNVLFRRKVTYGNYLENGRPLRMSRMKPWMAQNEDMSITWSDVIRVRAEWPGKIVIKGIMCAEDAWIALDHGADAIYVSNHGGRQFDRQPSTISVLQEVVQAVDGRCEVYCDGAVTRGADALAHLSGGATAAGLGRSAVYALAAGGEQAVSRLLGIFADEFTQAMRFCGVTSAREVTSEVRRDLRPHRGVAVTAIERFPAQPEPAALSSDSIRAAELVFTTVIPVGADGELVGETIEEQSEQVLRCLRAELLRAGSDLDHVLHLTIYLTGLARHRPAFDAAYRRYFGERVPVRCAVGVAEPARPDMLVELTAIGARTVSSDLAEEGPRGA